VDHLLQGELDKFSKEFPDYVLDQLSYYDVGSSSKSRSSSVDITKSQRCIGKQAEYVYHAFTYSMCLIAERAGFKVVSNQETGLGRCDVRIEPTKEDLDTAVILEFKIRQDNEDLVGAAERALDQIKEKYYHAGLPQWVKKRIEAGISFCGKLAHVKICLLDGSKNWQVVSSCSTPSKS
jgi:hypothetical protein